MNLINKKLLQQKYNSFGFPFGEKSSEIKDLIEKWQIALKDRNLDKTKEIEVQGRFLITFFDEILGYKFDTSIEKSEIEWNLKQHPQIDSGKGIPDGSLGFFTKDNSITKVVIELKDAKTSLDKKQDREGHLTPVEQAYRYANKEDKCKWIIVSNFREIRLYNKNRSEAFYEKFDIFDLSNESEFKRFYFLLSKENLISKDGESVIDVLASETTIEEQDITKKFYSEFKTIRLSLLNHLIENNSDVPRGILLEKTQKMLDRFIFTLFCEDTVELLPADITKKTYDRAINSFATGDERVWNEFKGLFQAIDKGREMPHINAYNGGLFKPDEILDNLHIKDSFWKEIIKLSDYDYQTDLNVNILGHIFEQSISDLEEIKDQILFQANDGNTALDNSGNPIVLSETPKIIEKLGKRKKDGIYYTPEYITRYIVENTLGAYLHENPDKLETVKVLDPACGSGAFPNQVHSYLLNEYKIRHEEKILEKEKLGEAVTLFDYNPAETDKGILLNNIFGVDLNNESIEISKLALWLKTAKKTEPLQNLDGNFKTGNSLIDDISLVGDKSFNWSEKYSTVMDDGGFDVIVGNPPYGAKLNEQERKYINNKHQLGSSDTVVAFIDLAMSLLKNGGYLGFIVPKAFAYSSIYKKVRNKYIDSLVTLIDCRKVWKEVKLEQVIIIFKKGSKIDSYLNGKLVGESIAVHGRLNKVDSNPFGLLLNGVTHKEVELAKRIISSSEYLGSFIDNKRGGMFQKRLRKSGLYKAIGGLEISRLGIKAEKGFVDLEEGEKKDFLLNKGVVLVQNLIAHIENPTDHIKITATMAQDDGFVILDTLNKLSIKDESLLSPYTLVMLLNSKFMNWYAYRFVFGKAIRTMHFDNPVTDRLPVRNLDNKSTTQYINDNYPVYIQKCLDEERLISETEAFIKDSYGGLNVKYAWGWNRIIQTIDKSRRLDIEKQTELHIWYEKMDASIKSLNKEIKALDTSLNYKIYEMYELNDEEIDLIESSY